jgi:hypothetical protein
VTSPHVFEGNSLSAFLRKFCLALTASERWLTWPGNAPANDKVTVLSLDDPVT